MDYILEPIEDSQTFRMIIFENKTTREGSRVDVVKEEREFSKYQVETNINKLSSKIEELEAERTLWQEALNQLEKNDGKDSKDVG